MFLSFQPVYLGRHLPLFPKKNFKPVLTSSPFFNCPQKDDTILKCDNYVDDHMQGANPCTPRTTEMATFEPPNSEHFPTPIITKQCVFSNTHNYQTVSFSNTIFQSLPINYTILRQLIILKQDCKHAFQIKIKNPDVEFLKIRTANMPTRTRLTMFSGPLSIATFRCRG